MGERVSAGRLLAEWQGVHRALVPIAVVPNRSETWLDPGTGMALKLFSSEAPADARREVRVLRAARRAGLPVPAVKDEFAVRGRRGIVLDFVPGAPFAALAHDLGAENRRAAWRAAGRMLGTLHTVPSDGGGDNTCVHGKPNGNAFLVARRPGRSAVSGFVNFDDAGDGDPARDVAIAALDSLQHAYPLDAFVDGYRSARSFDRSFTQQVARHAAELLFDMHPAVMARVSALLDDGVFQRAFAGSPIRRDPAELAG